MIINQFFRLFLTIIGIFAIFGCASLSELAERKNWPEVQRLITKGADVNATDKYGNTALMWASTDGNMEIVHALIDKGADINAKSNTSTTALMCASNSGNIEVVQALIEKGADVNATDKQGTTALMFASKSGIAQALIDKGVGINAKNNFGTTALMWASKRGYKEVVQLLLVKGADVNAEHSGPDALQITSSGQIGGVIKGARETALSLAIKNRRQDIVDILRAHGAKE